MSDDARLSDLELIAACRRALRELPDAPERMIRRAESIWPGSGSLLTRTRALLSIDSWSSPLPALRSGSIQTRQLLFTTEMRDIDVRIAPGEGAWVIEGQVLGPADGGTLSVLHDGDQVATAELDELGTFRVEGLAAGRYQLVVCFANERVELPDVDVQEQGEP